MRLILKEDRSLLPSQEGNSASVQQLGRGAIGLCVLNREELA